MKTAPKAIVCPHCTPVRGFRTRSGLNQHLSAVHKVSKKQEKRRAALTLKQRRAPLRYLNLIWVHVVYHWIRR